MKKITYVFSMMLLLLAMNVQAQEENVSTLQNNKAAVIEKVATSLSGVDKITQTYDVRIELVDERTGQPVDPETLPGYFAIDQATNQVYYPGYYDYNEFYNLPAGTYRFDSYDGYFDGSSSEYVTLSPSLEGNDGFIVITLRYWSE